MNLWEKAQQVLLSRKRKTIFCMWKSPWYAIPHAMFYGHCSFYIFIFRGLVTNIKIMWKDTMEFWFLKPLNELRHRSCVLKKSAKLFKVVISNPFQSSPSILVPFCFRINPLVFFFLSKPLLLGFPTLEPQFRLSKRWLKISWYSSF